MKTNYNKGELKTSVSEESTNLLNRHLNSFVKNDLQTLMSDYTEESVFITQDEIYVGLNEIANFFTNLMPHFPNDECTIKVDKMVVKNELGFIVWHANTPSLDVLFGTDTFMIRDGKIYQQTFAAQINFLTN